MKAQMKAIALPQACMKICTAVFLVLALGAGSAQAADAGSWLHGTWQLSEDKKKPGFTDDYIDFFADGAVTLRDSKKTFANCTYSPTTSLIMLKCIVRGQEKLISFRISPDKRSLTNPLGDVYKKSR